MGEVETPLEEIPIVKEIPVIDLEEAKGEGRKVVIQQIMKALDEYYSFQVINHGISQDVMDDAIEVLKEFFSLPMEDKKKYEKATGDFTDQDVTLYSSKTEYFGTDKYEYSRDILQHNCVVGNEDSWPANPPRYRDVIKTYSIEVRKLSKMVLSLVSEGLGLDSGYFDNEDETKLLGIHYPACAGPVSTMGCGGHCDPNLITVLQQKVYGLQIMNKQGKWVGVEPLPNAFFVNAGLSLTVISNGKLTGVPHRVVANPTQPRISIGTFVNPRGVIEPAKSLVAPNNPPKFKSVHWACEFIPHYLQDKSFYHAALEHFKLN